MIEPVIDALTTPVRPFESAITAMINSAALPNVAFSSPPTPSPMRAARASVARPIQPASGMMPIAAQIKSAVWLPPPGQKRSASATGTKIRTQFSDGFMFTISVLYYSLVGQDKTRLKRDYFAAEKPRGEARQHSGSLQLARDDQNGYVLFFSAAKKDFPFSKKQAFLRVICLRDGGCRPPRANLDKNLQMHG